MPDISFSLQSWTGCIWPTPDLFLLLDCYSSWPPSVLHFLVPAFLSLYLTLHRTSHEGGSHLKVQPNVSNRGRDVPEEKPLHFTLFVKHAFLPLACSFLLLLLLDSLFLYSLQKRSGRHFEAGGQWWWSTLLPPDAGGSGDSWTVVWQTQTPVFCHWFDDHSSPLHSFSLCLPLHHSLCSDLLVCLSEGICQDFCSLERCV